MKLFDPKKLLVIAGPCMLENEHICREVAEELIRLRNKYENLNFLFSGSFDKANRTSLSSERGPGLEKGLGYLRMIRVDYAIPVITDIHLPEQARLAADVCDALQIPAFLSRQTDLLVAAAKTGKCINVKKGQFMAPQDMKYVVDKLEQSGAKEIWQVERGTTFGYRNLVVDMRGLKIMKSFGHPVALDSTHSVQLPGGEEGKSGGDRQYIEPLTLAALAAGADGLYIETHPNPEAALSDGPSQVKLNELEGLFVKALKVWEASK